MKKLIIIVCLISLLGGCATMGSQSNDPNYTQKNLQVVEKTVQQNFWDVGKIMLQGVIKAVLLNNYLPW